MAEKYFKTYIRIDTPSYYNNNSYGCGFGTEEQEQNYDKAEQEVIDKLGLEVEKGSELTTSRKTYKNYCYGKNNDIFFNPQNISGIMTEEMSLKIAEVVNESNIFQVRKYQDGTLWIDRYEEYLDITKEEYTNLINEKKQEIRDMYLELCKTPRKYLFKSVDTIKDIIFNKVQIETLNKYKEPLNDFLRSVMNELLNNGLLIAHDDKYIRTTQKSELKELKKKLKVA